MSKAVMEGAFVDGLALLQPTAGYMRLVNDRILCVWRQRCAEAGVRTAEQERRVKATRQKLDRLDEAFLYSESIDLDTDSRQRDRLREELTLSTIDYHTEAVEELTWRAPVAAWAVAPCRRRVAQKCQALCAATRRGSSRRRTSKVPE